MIRTRHGITYLNANDVARRLGCTRRTVTNLVNRGLLVPHARAGQLWNSPFLFDPGDVEKLARSGWRARREDTNWGRPAA
jgi:DNA-binding transcriptional MerR regulator